MPLVQKVEKKSDLDDIMNKVQEKIQEKDAESAVLWGNVISQNFKDTQMVELRKLKQFVYALFTQITPLQCNPVFLLSLFFRHQP